MSVALPRRVLHREPLLLFHRPERSGYTNFSDYFGKNDSDDFAEIRIADAKCFTLVAYLQNLPVFGIDSHRLSSKCEA